MAANAFTRIRVLARVPVSDLSCADGGADGARGRAGGRAVRDPSPDDPQDRPTGAWLRHGHASEQERHADHGRRSDPVLDRAVHAALVRSKQPFRLDRAVGHTRFRRHRLGRRLGQGGAQGSRGHAFARQVFVAVVGWPGCRGLSAVQHFRSVELARGRVVLQLGALGFRARLPAQDQSDGAVFQGGQLSAGRHRFRDPDLPGDRRCEQRGQPDGWPRWPGDHAGRDGRLGAGRVRLCHGKHHFFQVPVVPAHPRFG